MSRFNAITGQWIDGPTARHSGRRWPYCRVCNQRRPTHRHGRVRLRLYAVQRRMGIRA